MGIGAPVMVYQGQTCPSNNLKFLEWKMTGLQSIGSIIAMQSNDQAFSTKKRQIWAHHQRNCIFEHLGPYKD